MEKLKKRSYGLILPFIAIVGFSILHNCRSQKSSNFESKAVKNFETERYLGQWYEIARFDFKYEKDLKNVTANYSKKEDGKIKVVNKGFNYIKNEWEEAQGKAKFVGEPTNGALRVSFFGPFYSGYNVVMLDDDYQNALVFGDSTDYIWILSRHKTISNETKEKFVNFAKENGYSIQKLVWTIQE